MNELKRTIKVALIAVGVLVLWFTMGFIIPIFLGLEDSGRLGDTFGSINSLFTAFSIVGLSYTILLQLEIIADQRKQYTEQKKQDKANFLIRMVYELKGDLSSLESRELKGVAVFGMINRKIEAGPSDFLSGSYDHYLIAINNFCHQLIYLIERISTEKEINDAESDYLRTTIAQLFSMYFFPLGKIVRNANHPLESFNRLKETTSKLKIKIEKFLEIEYDFTKEESPFVGYTTYTLRKGKVKWRWITFNQDAYPDTPYLSGFISQLELIFVGSPKMVTFLFHGSYATLRLNYPDVERTISPMYERNVYGQDMPYIRIEKPNNEKHILTLLGGKLDDYPYFEILEDFQLE